MPASAIASASAIAAAAADVAAQRAAAQMHGVFAVNKPAGISCTGVLDYLKRNLGRGAAAEPFAAHFEREAQLRATGRKIRRPRTALDLRVGHGGTLDVEAAGVLVVGLGRGCKRLDGFLRGPKAYVADARLGVATDTHDAEGRVTRLADAAHVDAPRLRQALPRFTGDIWQRPPAFSAARVDGRRLYEYARAGELPPTEPKARCVHVASISLARLANPAGGHWLGSRAGALPADAAQYYAGGRRQWAEGRGQPAVGDVLLPFANDPSQPHMQLAVRCGGGVYVRSLVHDLGHSVGAAATMLTLVRLAQGALRLDRDAVAVDDLAYVDRVAAAMRHAEDVCAAA